MITDQPNRKVSEVKTSWQSPSNIALIKYWGKHGDQLPNNPSLSITLSKAHTKTTVTARPAEHQTTVDFMFEGEPNAAFAKRIEGYIRRFRDAYPALAGMHFQIASSNSFPHSAGIASSASAMSALALCLISMIQPEDSPAFWQEASDMARQGSGSACRSVYGPVAAWGKTTHLPDSSDLHAVRVPDVDSVFSTFQDAICIVDTKPKPVSSSTGHGLMHNHPYAKERFEQAHRNFESLLEAMRRGNLERFIEITESEALSLHAMMMTSSPSFVLMRPSTIAMIEQIRSFRQETGIPICFTLDAGPNVHILYPKAHASVVMPWLDQAMQSVAPEGRILYDHAGSGPVKIEKS